MQVFFKGQLQCWGSFKVIALVGQQLVTPLKSWQLERPVWAPLMPSEQLIVLLVRTQPMN